MCIRDRFQENQKATLLADDGGRSFFKQTKNYLSKQRPRPFDVMDVFPGRDEQTTANELANPFNSISSEFSPLNHATYIFVPQISPYQYYSHMKLL